MKHFDPAPSPTGAYAVGTLTYTIKDQRPEARDPSVMRSVAARVYYPVLKSSVDGKEKEHHLTPEICQAMKKVFKIPMNYEKLEQQGRNVSECYPNAPKIEGEKFPLIMFHHGVGSYREGNSFLCIELASHGYIVISVTHPGEALCAEFDDGTVQFFDKTVSRKAYEPMFRGIVEFGKLTKAKGSHEELAERFDELQRKYCRFMMSRLDEWVKDNDAAAAYAREHLSDMIDFTKGIGVTGHSFGGNTAYRLCTDNPEYVCGINIDGGLFGDYADSILNRPFLQISCRDNETVVTRVYLKHTKPVYKVLFRDMRHLGFSDMKHLINFSVGKLGADELHENLCKVHLEFFDTYLKGLKKEPDIRSNDVITVEKIDADM